MITRWVLAFVHLLALPIGFAAIVARARALSAISRGADARTAFAPDAWWGLAALLWIATGLIRYLAGTEKPFDYYNSSWLFMLKMALLTVILLLEIWPIVTLIRWRLNIKRSGTTNTAAALSLARISIVQAVLVLLMVVAATGMARAIGLMNG